MSSSSSLLARVRSPWGISARLLVAFASVAVLAAAANFIVERSVSIVTGSSVQEAPPAPKPVVEKVTAPLAPEPEAPAPVETLSGDELIRAIERFDESVYLAVQSDAVEAQARYRQSGKDVDRALKSFMARAEALGERSCKSIPGGLRQHQGEATKWIELSQARRELLREYSETLERMNGRVNASLDGAFKIFGRVVARQSLVQLNTSLSGLRDSFAGAVRTGSTSPEIFESLNSAEAAFGKSLQDNAKSLRGAESDEWFPAMEKDFAALTKLREELVKTHQDLVTIGNGFVAQTAKLLTRMPKDVAAPPAAKAPKTIVATIAAKTPAQAEPAAPEPLKVEAQPQKIEPVETIAPAKSNRALVAWISIAVLALLLLDLHRNSPQRGVTRTPLDGRIQEDRRRRARRTRGARRHQRTGCARRRLQQHGGTAWRTAQAHRARCASSARRESGRAYASAAGARGAGSA